MHSIIDVAQDVRASAAQLAAAGVATVIRYYNLRNSSAHPSKCLTTAEVEALHGAGLSVAVVFEQRGGAPDKTAPQGHIEDLTARTGERDGARALELAAALGQPGGSAIYFAVDHDFTAAADVAQIEAYFTAARHALGGTYLTGIYGSAMLAKHLKARGLIEHIWLAARGWSGTEAQLASGDWSLFQKYHNLVSPVGRFHHDANIANPALPDFGQFGPAAAGAPPAVTPRGLVAEAQFAVTARNGLNLRGGPGESFKVLKELPFDTLVGGLERAGDWIKVDVEGDGVADGYMHRNFLKPLAGDLPLTPPSGGYRQPIDVARAELAADVKEWPGRASNNPRIMMYFTSTTYAAKNDETSWCSAFVNYCVEQAGLKGTDSAWARSWHDEHWGHAVTDAPQEGDIAVFSRESATEKGGHVGFFLGEHNGWVRLLGGNQSNRVCIDSYPKDDVKGRFAYKLLSVRRG